AGRSHRIHSRHPWRRARAPAKTGSRRRSAALASPCRKDVALNSARRVDLCALESAPSQRLMLLLLAGAQPKRPRDARFEVETVARRFRIVDHVSLNGDRIRAAVGRVGTAHTAVVMQESGPPTAV